MRCWSVWGALQEAVNGEEEGGEEDADAAAGLDLSLSKKKKKRKPKARTDEEFGALVEDTEPVPAGEKENEDDGLPGQPKLPWDGTDRDYTYQELLGKPIFSVEQCPGFIGGDAGQSFGLRLVDAILWCRSRFWHTAGEQPRADRREAPDHHETATGAPSDLFI